jgi:large subunit ribosomal protein L15
MKLNDLKPNEGAKRDRKRVSRGIAAGQGKTAGRGTKGQHSRQAFGVHLYHQGGNLPINRRLPFLGGEGISPINRSNTMKLTWQALKNLKLALKVTPQLLADNKMLQ